MIHQAGFYGTTIKMKCRQPKVTVIIPCYNRDKFIRETVDSVLSQTYPNIEIVVIDDGSTDNSRKVLEGYGSRIKILEHPGGINKGQSAAINLAMCSTESEYVAVLDSDDVWMPERIRRQVEFLENNPDFGLVYVDGFAIDENGKILYKLMPPGHVEENRPEKVLLNCYFHPLSTLVRRSVYKLAGGFDETMRSSQDHDMAIRLAEVAKMAYIDEPLWYYRRHQVSLSQNHARRRWETGFRILDNACRRRHYGWDIRRRRLAVLYFRLGQCLLEERRIVQSGLYFLMAGLLDPLRAINVLMGKETCSGLH